MHILIAAKTKEGPYRQQSQHPPVLTLGGAHHARIAQKKVLTPAVIKIAWKIVSPRQSPPSFLIDDYADKNSLIDITGLNDEISNKAYRQLHGIKHSFILFGTSANAGGVGNKFACRFRSDRGRRPLRNTWLTSYPVRRCRYGGCH